MKRAMFVAAIASTLSCSVSLGSLPCHDDGQCPTGSYCKSDGKCEVSPACPAGTTACGEKCVDLPTAVAHCGACGHACPAPQNGSAVCAAGQCDFTCPSGVKTGAACLIAPPAPAGLTAQGGDKQIALSWQASMAADGYELRRAAQTGGPYVAVATGSQIAHTDGGLADGARFFYVVVAKNAAGDSPPSSEASAVTNLPAPAGLSVTSAQPDRVELSWGAVAGATGYLVQRSSDGGTTWV